MDILKASVSGSLDGLLRTELWYDVVLVDGVYELTSYTIRHVAGRRKVTKENGVNRLIMPDALKVSGRSQEFLDKQRDLVSYTLSVDEKKALRSLTGRGLPPGFQLGWERENRGPMSPTFEQSVVAENEGSVNGVTFTITNPTAGNLLVICHGNADGNSNSPSVASGFNPDETAVPANFGPSMGILSKIASGSEGTSLAVTHTTSEADPNSGWFAEISGMASVSFTDGFNNVPDAGSGVTSRSGGSITTTIADTLLIGAFGYTMDGSPTSFTYDPTSYTQQAFIEGLAGASDHGTRICTRVVSSIGTYTPTLSWTGSNRCSGVHGAFVIDAATGPTITIPTGYIPTNNLGPRTISGISVTEGDDPTSLVTFTCTLGKGTMTMTASGSSAISGNGTNAISIIGGSEADINNTLATFAFTGLEPTRENVTVAVLATDGTLNDSENLVLLNHRTSLTIVADSYADLVAMIQTAKMILPEGSTSGQVEITAEDDDMLPDAQTITLFVPSGTSGGGFLLQFRRRRRQ